FVDTIGYNDRSWLPTAIPHTEKLHVIERYRRPDLAHLNVDVTIDDPGTLTKPWQLHMTWTLAPGEEILETVCENDQYRARVLGKYANAIRPAVTPNNHTVSHSFR